VDRLLSMKEVAERLGVSIHWLYQASSQRRFLDFVHVGRLVRVAESEVKKFIEQNTVEREDERWRRK